MIELPARFKSVLEKDSNLQGIVIKTLHDFSLILEENSLYFFEEYTDHGVKHIQSVINSANEIIPDDTFGEIMSAKNIALLILAIILHDLGMHTSFQTFTSMLRGSYNDIQINILDKKSWNDEWLEYLDRAKKFNTKETVNIFGKENYSFSIPNLSDKDKLTGEDKKLIGEFIRRNHPRISHEIALKGIPVKDNFIKFAADLEFSFKTIVGIIARSHGLNIRNTFSFLELISKEEWSKPYNIDIIYLMVILRVADYFQFDNTRVNPITVKLKTFNSPISRWEFQKHLAIEFVKESSKDPETLFVQANPTNSVVYLKLTQLLVDIQKEVDLSWAIMGEIYGKEQEWKQPRIKYRRIKSNILTAEFYEQAKYVAKKVTFHADEELSKLLIAPLYGNNPSYGVRELLQNAIDACLERKHVEGSYDPKITVKLFKENEQFFFEIKDNGKGMTLFEITDYFLKAGSSFRKSYDWQKKYTNEKGKSNIQRSGRFGVGALAAFLLGEKLIVHSKSYFGGDAHSFTAQLDFDQIEIQKEIVTEAGTSITIPVLKGVYEYLVQSLKSSDDDIVKWTNWYAMRFPLIEYFIEGEKVIPYKKFNPAFNDQLPNDWSSIKDKTVERVDWTYSSNYSNRKFTCNGIVIPKSYTIARGSTGISTWPIISVFDPNGKLSLNLNRNSLDGNLPFEDELIKDIYKDLLAQLLSFKFSIVDSNLNLESNFSLNHSSKFGSSSYNTIKNINSFIFTNEGFGLRYSFFLKNLKKDYLITAHVEKKSSIKYSLKEYVVSFEEFSEDQHWYNREIIDPYYSYSKSGRITCKTFFFEAMLKTRSNPLRQGLLKNMENKSEYGEWIVYTYRHRGDTKFVSKIDPAKDFIDALNVDSFIAFSESYIPMNSPWSDKYELLDQLLETYLSKDCIIPYDLEKRKEKFPKAFEELNDFMQKY